MHPPLLIPRTTSIEKEQQRVPACIHAFVYQEKLAGRPGRPLSICSSRDERRGRPEGACVSCSFMHMEGKGKAWGNASVLWKDGYERMGGVFGTRKRQRQGRKDTRGVGPAYHIEGQRGGMYEFFGEQDAPPPRRAKRCKQARWGRLPTFAPARPIPSLFGPRRSSFHASVTWIGEGKGEGGRICAADKQESERRASADDSSQEPQQKNNNDDDDSGPSDRANSNEKKGRNEPNQLNTNVWHDWPLALGPFPKTERGGGKRKQRGARGPQTTTKQERDEPRKETIHDENVSNQDHSLLLLPSFPSLPPHPPAHTQSPL